MALEPKRVHAFGKAEPVTPETARVTPPKRGMVNWYAPSQLISTGIEVLISEVMAKRFDYRMMEDIGPAQRIFDYTRHRGAARTEIWFDYLADTGDGWNPTYAIASLVAQPALTVGARTLEKGRFLVLGGDEVYPLASKQNYKERFVAPFEAALPGTPGVARRHLFAIPGNHDWYDALVSFSRQFMQRRSIGGWFTRQRRSYFALKLPQRWWLWAVDVQLESDVDFGQRHYFREVARHLHVGDRVILASAEPDWLRHDVRAIEESNLLYLEDRIIKQRGATVYLWLAGDYHHYRRHENRKDARFQRITSGGGGAYLSPTHGPLFGAANTASRRVIRVGGTDFVPRCSFPSPATSFRLSLLNFFFLFKNWRFGLLTGFAYLALTWGRPVPDPSGRWPTLWEELILYPSKLVLILLILAGFIFYADKERPTFRYLGGFVHGVAHIAAALLIADWTVGWVDQTLGGQASRLLLNFLGGLLLGPLIWGLYLLAAVNLFGAQSNEAFSALRIENYKHFLRLHITADGKLEIFPLGIKKVPRTSEARARYMLIEGPITIDPNASV